MLRKGAAAFLLACLPGASLIAAAHELSQVPPSEPGAASLPTIAAADCFRLANGPIRFLLFCDTTDDRSLDALLRGRTVPMPEADLWGRFQVRFGLTQRPELDANTGDALHNGSKWEPIVMLDVDVAGWQVYDAKTRTAGLRTVVDDRYFLLATELGASDERDLLDRFRKVDWRQTRSLARQLGTLFR